MEPWRSSGRPLNIQALQNSDWMNDWRYERSNRHDVVAIPLVWFAFALSLLVHIAALWFWHPALHDLSAANADKGKASAALAVELEPKPAAKSSPPPAPASPPPKLAQSSPKPRATPPKQRPAPPVIAQNKPEAEVAIVPTPPVQEPRAQVAPKPIEGDLASYVEARRRERGEPAASPAQSATPNTAESDIERRNRIVASNLGLNRTPTFGYDPKSAGGIFQIEHLSYEYADFYFFGLNRDIGRNTKQLIEVKKGGDSDIRVAVVRKMIAIIRDNVSGDFVWVSRHGPVTMSARLSDNAGLEEFIMRDVFPDARPSQ